MISIIMPVHNQIEFTKKAIESLYEFTDEKDFELIIVDNGSASPVYNELDRKYLDKKNLQISEQLLNLGWCRGLNQGFKRMSPASDFVLWANNDIVFEKDWLPKMLAHFRPGVGAVGPTSNYVNGRQRVEAGREEWEEEVNWLIGFFLMFRRGVIDAIGKVDERFNEGGSEEWDYIIRMQQKFGLKCVIARDVFIHHFGSQTIMNTVCKTKEDYQKYCADAHKILKDKWGEAFINSWMNQKISISQKVENLPWPLNCKLGRAIPHTWSHIEYQTALSLEGMRKPNTIVLEAGRGGELDTKRERQIESGMAQGCTHFFIGDGDMVYPANILIDLFKILNDGADIAGGLCYRGYPPYDPIAWHPTEGRLMLPFVDYKFGDIVDVGAVGCACLLVKREVFEKLPKPWFQNRYKRNEETGEEGDYEEGDHYFTRKATQAGFKLRLHTKYDVDHLRSFPVNRQLWLTHGILTRCEDWGTIISLFKKLGERRWIDRELRGCDVEVDPNANQRSYEIGVLYRFLEGKKIKNVLEIGTQFGGTALLWASLVKARNGHVCCVDKTFDKVIYRDNELASSIMEVEGDSHSKNVIDRITEAIMNNGGSIDFLFIDGDHSYMNVKADFENYFRFVRAGGWVAFHDIIYNKMHPKSIPDVQRFWEEVKQDYNHFEITDPNEPLMGIGILQKPL